MSVLCLSSWNPFSLNMWRLCLHMSSGVVRLHKFVCVSPVVSGEHRFFRVGPPFCLVQSLPISSMQHSETCGGRMTWRHPIWTEHFNVSFSAHCLLVSFALDPIFCKKKFLWWWLSDALTCGYSKMSLGVIWCYVPQQNRSSWNMVLESCPLSQC